MRYRYNLSREAEDDVLEAYLWYEQQKPGLGEELLESLDKAHNSILQSPLTYPIRYKKKVRAYLVERFPYLVLYVVEKHNVNVISIFNTSRDPSIWKERIFL